MLKRKLPFFLAYMKKGAAKPTFLEYVEFDGDSWIDIGYIPSSNTRVVGGFSVTRFKTSAACYIFGVFGDGANFGLNIGSNRKALNVPWASVSAVAMDNPNNFDQRYSFDISKNGAYIDGVLKLTALQFLDTFTATKSFFVGWSNGTSVEKIIGKIYPIKIYENDILMQDLHPALDPNGKVCMYDTVTKKYFYNAGTGELKAGGRFVESIVFDGASYIDTGVIPSNNMEFEAGVMFSAVQSTNLSIISSRDGEKRYQPIGAIQNKWSASIGATYDTNGLPVSANTRYDLRSVVSNGDSISLYSGNTLVSSLTSSGGIPAKSLYLFARNFDSVDSYTTGSLYYCKIWDNGTLVRDMRPYVDSDGVACFKDVVTDTLFYGKGTGTLGYTEFEPQEFIYLNGNQYIDTGVAFQSCTIETAVKYEAGHPRRMLTGWVGHSALYWGMQGNGQFELGGSNLSSKTNLTDYTEIQIVYDASANTAVAKVDGETGTYAITPSRLEKYTIGCTVPSSGNKVIGNVYYHKIYDADGKLIQDLIPVKRSDGVICMYDRVKNKHYELLGA